VHEQKDDAFLPGTRADSDGDCNAGHDLQSAIQIVRPANPRTHVEILGGWPALRSCWRAAPQPRVPRPCATLQGRVAMLPVQEVFIFDARTRGSRPFGFAQGRLFANGAKDGAPTVLPPPARSKAGPPASGIMGMATLSASSSTSNR
jgi:hypothetical protein